MKRRPTVIVMGCVLGVLVASLAGGCEEDAIRAYQAPKDAPARIPPVAHAPPSPTWDVPNDWVADPQPMPPLLAAWDAGPVRITVTRLQGAGGGILANINRWRGQLGLEPVSRYEDQPMTPLEIAGHPAALLDLASDTGRMAAVIYPREDRNATWFFKMTGPEDDVGSRLDQFTGFTTSTILPDEP